MTRVVEQALTLTGTVPRIATGPDDSEETITARQFKAKEEIACIVDPTKTWTPDTWSMDTHGAYRSSVGNTGAACRLLGQIEIELTPRG